MSTKSSIKWRDVTEGQIGFHLYDDVMDSFCATDGDPEPPVYLRLDGVEAELSTMPSGGVSVTVVLPRETARELGLLPAAGVLAVDLPEPDCWAILTPNGSKLVPPGEAKGRKDAYRLFSEEQVRELLHARGVAIPEGGNDGR